MNRRRAVRAAGLVLVLAALFAGSVAIARAVSSPDSPPGRQHALNGTSAAQQLSAALPRSISGPGSRLAGAAGDTPILGPDCLVPAAGYADSPVVRAVEQPIATRDYTGNGGDIYVSLFRFSASGIGQARSAIEAASSCVQPGTGYDNPSATVNNRVNVALGDSSAVYQTYTAPDRRQLAVRRPKSIDMLLSSKSWGLSVSVAPRQDDQGAPSQQIQLTGQAVPDLLRHIDRALGTSFWPGPGSAIPLFFPPDTPYVSAGGDTPAYRPSSIVLSGDGSFSLQNMRWSQWGQTEATGTGTVLADLCQPDCAEGRVAKLPARVTLSGVGYSCGYRVYTRAATHLLAKPPSGLISDSVTPLNPFC